MHTIKQILEQVDRVKPNAFSVETKLVWIAELDGKIALNVMLMDMAELDAFHYQYPDSLDKEPLVPFPHNVLYEKWLIAQIDAANEEWNRYANDIEIYNSYYKDFVRWFASTYQPAQGGMERCGTYPRYFLTAYGLAVQQGFTGSLQEWLLSLRGDPGATPQKGVDYYTEEELEEMLDRFSDRVPKDWFASGKEIPEEADLDGYREPGKFYAPNTAVASTLKNCPTDADFTLWVFDRVSDNRKNHMLIDGENRLFFRSENAGGWKEWVGWAALDETLEKRGFAADALAVKQALNKLTAADVGAAPAGYGLGTETTKRSTLDDMLKTGFYNASITEPATGYSGNTYGTHIQYSDDYAYQEMVGMKASTGITEGTVRRRYKDNGTWSDIEYVNPPMIPNKEYRTTERFNGAPVYTRLFPLGTATDGTKIEIDTIYPIRYCGRFGSFSIPFTSHAGTFLADVEVQNTFIKLITKGFASGANTYVQVWYLK